MIFMYKEMHFLYYIFFIYNEAEKNSLDILGFIFTHSGKKISRKRNNFKRDKRRIIYQS